MQHIYDQRTGAILWHHVGSIEDLELQERARQVVRDQQRGWRERMGLVPVPPVERLADPDRRTTGRLQCGCIEPVEGPSVVRRDGSCCACSP